MGTVLRARSSYMSESQYLATGVLCPFASFAFVALRFISRHVQRAAITLDDWLILPALVSLIGMGICSIIGTSSAGLPTAATTADAAANGVVEQGYKVMFAFQQLLVPANGFAKLSIVFFYRRVLAVVVSPTLNCISWIYIIAIILWILASFTLPFFVCSPVEDLSYWISAGPGWCFSTSRASTAGLGSDLALDVLIIIFPLPVITKLDIGIWRKLGLIAIFLVGLVAIAASAVRLAIFLVSLQAASPLEETTLGLTWWSFIEVALSIIAACLPNLMFLIRRIRFPGFSQLPASDRSRK